MVHYAGYCPRFHPSDFEVRTRDGVGADWPISYEDLKPHYERLELELPVAGEYWPWGDPHRYPHTAHPIAGGADVARGAARKLGIEMRVGPVGITNGAFGNRPHCIYRGFCLQGCKVNAKASPLVTHIPDAIEHGAEIRADCMAMRVELDDSSGRVTGVRYTSEGRERFQRADAVAVAGYSIETPRLLLELDQPPLPARPCQRQRPGRALRDGPGRAPGGRALPGGDADVQGAAPGDLLRAVLRDRPHARLRARVLDPDRRPAPDRAREPRAWPWPLGKGAARVHARLQPLVHARDPVRAAPAARQPGDGGAERHRRQRHPGGAHGLLTVRQRPQEHRIRKEQAARHLRGRRGARTSSSSTATRTWSAAAGWAQTPSRASSTAITGAGRCRTCSSPTGA